MEVWLKFQFSRFLSFSGGVFKNERNQTVNQSYCPRFLYESQKWGRGHVTYLSTKHEPLGLIPRNHIEKIQSCWQVLANPALGRERQLNPWASLAGLAYLVSSRPVKDLSQKMGGAWEMTVLYLCLLHMWMHTRVHLHTCEHAYMHAHLSMSTYKCICTYKLVCTCEYVYTWMCLCTYKNMGKIPIQKEANILDDS